MLSGSGRKAAAVFVPAFMCVCTLWPNVGSGAEHAPTPIIFDTDMYSDVDDPMALAMLHALQDRAQIKLIAVTISTEDNTIPSFVDVVDTFYRHPAIPIGIVHNGISARAFEKDVLTRQSPWAPNGVPYTRRISEMVEANGKPVYSRTHGPSWHPEDATLVLRRALAAEPDHSVVLVEVGYQTNLARLLVSKADQISPLNGYELVRKKVRLVSMMAGSFGSAIVDGQVISIGLPEFNVKTDLPAARRVFSEWPTPIVISGYEIGVQIRIGEKEFGRLSSHRNYNPIVDLFAYVAPAYRAISPNRSELHEHPTFDLTSVLYAALPTADYFSLSPRGRIEVDPDGATRFEVASNAIMGSERVRQYLIVSEKQKVRAAEAMSMLVTQPPMLH